MQISLARFSGRASILGIIAVVSLILLAVFGMPAAEWIRGISSGTKSPSAESETGGHDHADARDSVELSPQALKNIGYQPIEVKLGSYNRTISLPGIVVERPGQSQIRTSAPLGGIITKIYVIDGEAIVPGSPLFDIRLTHEELASAQGEFLKTVEALDVVNAEIRRLESLTDGVVAGKRVLEQKYERQKLEALMRAQRQALLLHGISDAEVDKIVETRELLQSLTVSAPAHEDDVDCAGDHLFHIQSLDVQVGQQVAPGDLLCIIADHCALYIEGTAFEEDAELLREAIAEGQRVSVDLLVRNRREPAIEGLKLLYFDDQVDRDSRASHFYIKLPNQVVLDRRDGNHRFLQWKFKPGQRVEISVPVERWVDRIVVPADAVVSDGAESYVYRQNGRRFERVPVHVEFRDQKSAVIDADGAIFPGETIAGKGAFPIHLALKSKSGGAVDPHAGHSH